MSNSQAWLVADTNAEAGGLETLPETRGLNVVDDEDFLVSDLSFLTER